MLLRAVLDADSEELSRMLLKVTDEYFAAHKTTPNEPSPVCQSFFLSLLARDALVSYRPLAVL